MEFKYVVQTSSKYINDAPPRNVAVCDTLKDAEKVRDNLINCEGYNLRDIDIEEVEYVTFSNSSLDDAVQITEIGASKYFSNTDWVVEGIINEGSVTFLLSFNDNGLYDLTTLDGQVIVENIDFEDNLFETMVLEVEDNIKGLIKKSLEGDELAISRVKYLVDEMGGIPF